MALQRRNIESDDPEYQALTAIHKPGPGSSCFLSEVKGSDLSDTTMRAMIDMLDVTSALILFLSVMSEEVGLDLTDDRYSPTITLENKFMKMIIHGSNSE